ncbi:MAG: short-chain dehydrogenase/reductase [Verrucomicrobiaceae bacterium]|nr:short-chain dehydrogenase/reductase [Verrucomicrobiaceae bacterium]
MGEFAGKVVIITGAGSGLGRAASIGFAREGATLCLAGRTESKLIETSRQIGGDKAIHVATDLGNPAACAAVIEATIKAFGRIDVLCNVAADVFFQRYSDVTPESWNQLVASNLTAPFFMMQAAMPHLLESHGNIVNVASTGGTMGQAYLAPYTATKFGLLGLTRSLAMEMMKNPVRINALSPGPMQTEMIAGTSFPDYADPQLVSHYVGMRPVPPPEDLVETLLFLASDRAKAVHGANWAADGGITSG